jgi:hypothetical protein
MTYAYVSPSGAETHPFLTAERFESVSSLEHHSSPPVTVSAIISEARLSTQVAFHESIELGIVLQRFGKRWVAFSICSNT